MSAVDVCNCEVFDGMESTERAGFVRLMHGLDPDIQATGSLLVAGPPYIEALHHVRYQFMYRCACGASSHLYLAQRRIAMPKERTSFTGVRSPAIVAAILRDAACSAAGACCVQVVLKRLAVGSTRCMVAIRSARGLYMRVSNAERRGIPHATSSRDAPYAAAFPAPEPVMTLFSTINYPVASAADTLSYSP